MGSRWGGIDEIVPHALTIYFANKRPTIDIFQFSGIIKAQMEPDNLPPVHRSSLILMDVYFIVPVPGSCEQHGDAQRRTAIGGREEVGAGATTTAVHAGTRLSECSPGGGLGQDPLAGEARSRTGDEIAGG